MNSGRGSGSRPDIADKGKVIVNPDPIIHDMSGLSIDNQQDAGWEVISKKTRNRSGSAQVPGPAPVRQPGPYVSPTPQPRWGSNGSGRGGNGSGSGFVNLNPKSKVNLVPNSSPNPSPWPVTPDPRKPLARTNPRPQLLPPQHPAPQPTGLGVQPPLAHGRNWAARVRPAGSQPNAEVIPHPPDLDPEPDNASDDDEDDDDGLADDSDDDLSDDYDSDASQKSHGTRKQNKWFKAFFDELDRLKVNEINEQTRQWHCPACANGPGAIEWYKGLQPLMTHAKTKGAIRVKLHRELATLLEEELRRRGTSVIPASEQYGKWKGLRETTTDHEIVWPPMVVIMNTILGKDENDKYVGMGNQELLDYFSPYAAKRARHSYGPKGHRGMSLLIFESDAVGYLEAERLHKDFEQQGTDRNVWERNPRLFLPGGQRQLYGYLARKEDLEVFNQHCQGKTRLKYEMRSYQEMVVGPMRQMNEDNQQLHWLQRKVVKQEQRSKVIEQSFDVVSKRLRDSVKSIALVRERTLKHHEETKEEMDYQEQFFKEQIEKVHKAIEEKEREFQNQLQKERSKATQSDIDSGSTEDRELRKKEIEMFIDGQEKGVEEFEAEKDQLIKLHEEKKLQLKREYLAKEVELEEQLDASLTALMEKYKPTSFHASSSYN